MKTKGPQLIEVTFLFQTSGERADPDRHLFKVRASLHQYARDLTFDLHGRQAPIEQLQPGLLDEIKAGLELVRGRVKAEDLVEEPE